MKKEEIQIIDEIKNIQKAILIKNKILREFMSLNSIHLRVAYMVFVVLSAGTFLYSEFTFNHRFIAGTIIVLFFFTTAIIFFQTLLQIAKSRAAKMLDENEKNQIAKYKKNSEEELIELKNELINKLMMLSINDYELFRFLLFKIDDEKLKEDFINHCYNTEIFDTICCDPNLLSIINELPINNKTENLISKVQKYLENVNQK